MIRKIAAMTFQSFYRFDQASTFQQLGDLVIFLASRGPEMRLAPIRLGLAGPFDPRQCLW